MNAAAKNHNHHKTFLDSKVFYTIVRKRNFTTLRLT